MSEPLPSDVVERLTRDFGERSEMVAALLLARRESEEFLSDHVLRCAVHAAGGQEQQLLALLETDYRDVIMAGEYDGGIRVRDLRTSFLIDSEDRLWAGEVACLMKSRGYDLVQVVARPATVGPFTYPTDFSEGKAMFRGARGDVVIEKRDRQWIIHGIQRELELHRLNRPYNDRQAFLDAVSGYLLSPPLVENHESRTADPLPPQRRPWWRMW